MDNSDFRSLLHRGVVIPAHPLALNAQRRLDERRQRALTRYYLAAGAGGLQVNGRAAAEGEPEHGEERADLVDEQVQGERAEAVAQAHGSECAENQEAGEDAREGGDAEEKGERRERMVKGVRRISNIG